MIQLSGAPPRIALIGTSGYATVYVDWLIQAHQEGIVQIVAATVLPNEQNLDSAQGLKSTAARFYSNYQEMFEQEGGKIDLCFIPTGIQWHARMSVAALEAGCNVLVEKPLAGSLRDVESVQSAEKRCNRWVAVGFQDMYTNEIIELKNRLLNGEIGKVLSVSMLGAWPRAATYYTRNKWAGKLQTDGEAVLDSPLNNAFAHFVNLSLFLAGDTLHESTNATVEKSQLYHTHDIESFDTAVVHATATNGVKLWFGVTHSTVDTREPRIEIKGESGSVLWEHESRCTISPTGETTTYIDVPKYDETRQEMFISVIKRLSDPNRHICDTGIARCHTHLIESLHADSTIKRVSTDHIENRKINGNGAMVPAIRDIVPRLERAFEQNGDLEALDQQAASN